ncbi:hypothetical protein PROFUN_16870 [Planoprotostelium fungivorum]|uniref:Uncharacterized protein n=1 Tax=Planoprotostelium fungivorum TaxID=1890364 RepID=A0A2P6MNE9_9EUKA|nr:hypothetical protein PROFUN_16870 [Planoprotostelium fungivorum]
MKDLNWYDAAIGRSWLRIRIRRCEFSSRRKTNRNGSPTSTDPLDTVEMATPRPRDDSYLSQLTTLDAKRNALAADVRRLTDQEASGPAKTATFTWITTATEIELDGWLTLSDEDFIDSVKAKGPAHSADDLEQASYSRAFYYGNGALQVVAAFDHFILDSLIFDWVRYAFWTKLQFHTPFTWIKRFAEGFGRAPN